MREIPEVKVLKALGDENRLRSLLALRDRELCVCQIVAMLDLAPSTVSKHLQILKDAGLVTARKKGRWVYYHMSRSGTAGLSRELFHDILTAAARSERARADADRLQEILRLDPEVLCERKRSV